MRFLKISAAIGCGALILVGSYGVGYVHGFTDRSSSLVEAAITTSALTALRDNKQPMAIDILETNLESQIAVHQAVTEGIKRPQFLIWESDKDLIHQIKAYRSRFPYQGAVVSDGNK